MEFLWQRGANNDTTAVADGGNAIADGDWTHLVFTGSAGGDYQFYVDGVPTTGGAFPDTFGHVNTNPLFIGSRNDLFTTWDGLLDDVAIFDRVLTEGQIQTILSGEFSEFLEPPSADFNGDGVVTELDYFVLSDHLYAHLDGPVVPADGDFNRDGSVDLVDFGMFKTEYPAVVAQALASVPEPSTVSLLLVAVWGLMGLPRRRLS
jgi:hypothetical protein